MTTLIIILVTIYLLSALGCWNWTRIAHSVGGIYEDTQITLDDLILSLLPIINTILSIMAWSEQSPRKDKKTVSSNRESKWLNKIFCIKNRREAHLYIAQMELNKDAARIRQEAETVVKFADKVMDVVFALRQNN